MTENNNNNNNNNNAQSSIPPSHPPSAPPPNSIMIQPFNPPPATLDYFRSVIPSIVPLLSSSSSSSSSSDYKHDYYPIQTWSRLSKPTTGEDGLFADTLANSSSIPHCLTLRRRQVTPPPQGPPIWPSPTESPPPEMLSESSSSSSSPSSSSSSPDVMMLLGLSAPGICGHPSTVHGGVIATMIDESMSLAVALQSLNPLDSQHPRGHIYTAQLDVRYKKPVSTPGAVVVRSKVVARLGRKFWVRAQVLQEEEDGGVGGLSVMTDAMAFWLETVPVKESRL